MIYGFTGDFSSGKTACLTFFLMKEMYKGTRVITTYPIDVWWSPPGYPRKHLISECITNGEEFRKKIEDEDNCVFGCDETAIYLPNEFWNKMSEKLRFKLHLVEHYNCDLLYTVQKFHQSTKRLRDLTNLVFMPQKHLFSYFTCFKIDMYEPEAFEGVPSPQKLENYYAGSQMIWPSEARASFRAYQRTYKFEKFHFGDFMKKI